MIKQVFITVFISFLFSITGFSQTVLSSGDIVIVGFNADNPDEFSFIALTAISNTTVIKFTDNGWLNTGSFRGGEGELTWTANANVNCGDEVFVDGTNLTASTGTVTATGGSFALSTGGDQIIAFQGTQASPTNIYAINFDGAGVWQVNATSANNSALPTGLTNGTSAVALNENDDGKYNCSVTTGQAAILAAVGNNTNWTLSGSRVALPVGCGFTCAGCVVASEPTINASSMLFSNIDCFSMDISWTAGNGNNRIVVASTSPITGTPTDQNAYTANAGFGLGSTIAANEFVVYNGNGTSVSITNLTSTTIYYFAVFEYNGTIANCEENYLVTSVLTDNEATITCTCPEITGILVDACGGTIEGINEFFTFENGNNSLPIDSITASFPNGGDYCNSGCGSQNWTTNPTYVASLNTTAGCAGLFVEVDPIPSGGKVIVFTGATPTYNFDFSGLCGTGPYYAIFANNASTSGRFANYNSTCALRTLNVDFGNSCADAVSYDRCLLSNTDGDYVTFDAAGNPTYQNDGCTPSAILPISLLYFSGEKIENNTNLLEWSTSAELNNDYYTIERSTDAINFYEIGLVDGAGNSSHQLYYQFTDKHPANGINYYQLKQTDYNGDYTYSSLIAINNASTAATVLYSNKTLNIVTEAGSTLRIVDLAGREVYETYITTSSNIDLTQYKSGIYIYQLISRNSMLSDKFVIR